MRKKFVILIVLSAVLITGCNQRIPPSDKATFPVTETTAELITVTTIATTLKTAVTEITGTFDEEYKRQQEEKEQRKCDEAIDKYLTALKEKKLTEYFGFPMSDYDYMKEPYNKYFENITYTDIKRSEVKCINTEYGTKYIYDITMVISESNKERFPVGESEWTASLLYGRDCWEVIICPKNEKLSTVDFTGRSNDAPSLCYEFEHNFRMLTDCEDISNLQPNREDEEEMYNFYYSISKFLWCIDCDDEVTEEEFYSYAEQYLGITGLDVNEFELYKSWGTEALMTPPKADGIDCGLVSHEQDETGETVVLEYYADDSHLVIAKKISYRLEKTEKGLRLVSSKVIEDNGCSYIAWWSN